MDSKVGVSSIEWVEKWRKLINKVELVSNENELTNVLEGLISERQPSILAFVNAHAMNSVITNNEFYHSLCGSDIIFRDGSGMAKLFRRIRVDPGLNLNGTDLIPKIIAQYSQQKIALLGTQEPYLESAKSNIQNNYKVGSDVITMNGFLEEGDYLKAMLVNKPDLIVLGMGMPKQESVATNLKENLKHPCLIICGGAIIDFLGEKVSRAPLWMRNNGIEWVYRLLIEPKRMFRRYLIGNPVFIFRMLIYKERA